MDSPNDTELMVPKEEDESDESLDSLMQLENFKSNFARRLSSRSISKSPLKKDNSPKFSVRDDQKKEDVIKITSMNNVFTKIDTNKLDLSPVIVPKPKTENATTVMENTKLTLLNMEIETLRWQLTQTESNRQIQIALLKEIVCFLSKVKDHMNSCMDNSVSDSIVSDNKNERSFIAVELPRSHSVINLKKNQELLNAPKKLKNKRISKSNSNVARYEDIQKSWTQSNIVVASQEKHNNKKLSEEITRLITLANDVIKTKIPDLACTNEPNESISDDFISKEELLSDNETKKLNNENDGLSKTNDNSIGSLISSDESNQIHYGEPLNLNVSVSPNKYSEEEINTNPTKKCRTSKKKDHFLSNNNEVESGFSSMNSYQEIGVPEINVISTSIQVHTEYGDNNSEIIQTNPEILDHTNVKKASLSKRQLYLYKLLNRIKDDNKYSYMRPYEEIGVPDINDISPSIENDNGENIYSTSFSKDNTGYIDLYQNIGIPVINVIPPSSAKDCIDSIFSIDKLLPDEKQEGKVFWV